MPKKYMISRYDELPELVELTGETPCFYHLKRVGVVSRKGGIPWRIKRKNVSLFDTYDEAIDFLIERGRESITLQEARLQRLHCRIIELQRLKGKK